MGVEKILSYGKRFSLGLLTTLMLNCTDKEVTQPEPEDIEGKIRETIVDVYYKWAEKSRQHDYYGMLALVVPGSSMEGATNVCKDQWDFGNEFSYSFNSVNVGLLEESPPKAYVRGNWTRYQNDPPPREGGFYGFSIPIDGDYEGENWKLNGMNWSHEINWWK